MTPEELAHKVVSAVDEGLPQWGLRNYVRDVIAAAVVEEREACAKVAETTPVMIAGGMTMEVDDRTGLGYATQHGKHIAASIRARGSEDDG